ncbi:unnamed protein product [Echinostoma caproni]|uniref:Reverse transcriptase domain-containing protein n=1 Tax=Echinostoma caproni TaxID=27848 RepID=A0A183AAV3_9TREM|nr:unnamed protein product [Echinostoma caproni]
MFLLFVDDLPSRLNLPCLLYADDVKLWRVTRKPEDHHALQLDLDKLLHWEFAVNSSKCAHMRLGRETLDIPYQLNNVSLRSTATERDL